MLALTILSATTKDGTDKCCNSYINYAFGDEDLQTIYGDNVARLQRIKRQYDPLKHFNQFFPLT